MDPMDTVFSNGLGLALSPLNFRPLILAIPLPALFPAALSSPTVQLNYFNLYVHRRPGGLFPERSTSLYLYFSHASHVHYLHS